MTVTGGCPLPITDPFGLICIIARLQIAANLL